VTPRLRGFLITAIVALTAGFAGVGLGKLVFDRAPRQPTLHEVIHRELRLTAEQLYGLFASLAGEAVFAQSQNLIRVLIENRRLSLVPEIRDLFEDLKNEREGIVEAQITSAFPLEGASLATLVADLEQRFKRKVKPQVNVDATLIGGVRMQVGDEVIDGSVRGKLAAMAVALTK